MSLIVVQRERKKWGKGEGRQMWVAGEQIYLQAAALKAESPEHWQGERAILSDGVSQNYGR